MGRESENARIQYEEEQRARQTAEATEAAATETMEVLREISGKLETMIEQGAAALQYCANAQARMDATANPSTSPLNENQRLWEAVKKVYYASKDAMEFARQPEQPLVSRADLQATCIRAQRERDRLRKWLVYLKVCVRQSYTLEQFEKKIGEILDGEPFPAFAETEGEPPK